MRTSEIRSKLKRNSLVFFTYKKLTDGLYRMNYIDCLFKKQVKSRKVIRKELDLMKEYWKCDPMDYYMYRLFEKEMTQEELLDYIPTYYFYNYYVPSIYDESMISMAASKIQMNEYFRAKQIPTAKAVATAMKGKIVSDGETLDYSSFIEKLRLSESQKFFMKPDKGKGGKGIFRIEKFGEEIFINKKIISRKSFDEIIKHQDYLIQEGVIQRDDIMQLYPTSVNTLRVVTQNFNGDAVISATSIRMGRNGTFVDNCASGGLMANIDLKSGMISYALDDDMIHKFSRHPNTGLLFEGMIIRDWENIKKSILDLAVKSPEFPDIGWDLAIVEGGIVVIELNLNYGIDMQGMVGGMRRTLHIDPFISPKKVQV